MKKIMFNLTLLVFAALSVQALTPYRPSMKGDSQMFPRTTALRAAAKQAANVIVDPAPGDVMSLQSFNITFPDAIEVSKGSLSYSNAPYVCMKGSGTRNWCFNISTKANVLTVAMSSELIELGKYELHLPAGFYNVDGTPSTEELVFDYTIGEPQTGGVDNIVSASECVSTQYFDINGREVKNPSEGLYIRKQTFADGKVEISKVYK